MRKCLLLQIVTLSEAKSLGQILRLKAQNDEK